MTSSASITCVLGLALSLIPRTAPAQLRLPSQTQTPAPPWPAPVAHDFSDLVPRWTDGVEVLVPASAADQPTLVLGLLAEALHQLFAALALGAPIAWLALARRRRPVATTVAATAVTGAIGLFDDPARL